MAAAQEHKYTNRLANEKSPYLLVDWYPWSEEAFGKARQEDKPIFLSVGYSTCQVNTLIVSPLTGYLVVPSRNLVGAMSCQGRNEHESFENEDVAKIMNENFVNIKGVLPCFAS
ncbi:hypothetical protein BC937DRAFT_94554 [Endogone sp. FLAS-F59071]|nr:hypothetical protein BC937DRAFT_94554 [Endogone sp. FLAS-F59071]|eukprot:RUS20703.1 hypothetical protein BC937DRAFT_94554 [Endogone sp. FLAS-F59071]